MKLFTETRSKKAVKLNGFCTAAAGPFVQLARYYKRKSNNIEQFLSHYRHIEKRRARELKELDKKRYSSIK